MFGFCNRRHSKRARVGMSMEEVLALNAELVERNSQLEAILTATHREVCDLQRARDAALDVFEAGMKDLALVQEQFETLVREIASTKAAHEALLQTNAEITEIQRQRFDIERRQLEHRSAVYVDVIRRLAGELQEQAVRTNDYEFMTRCFQQARDYILQRDYTESAILLYAMVRCRQ